MVRRAMRRRSIQTRSINGAATSQNGNVAPSAYPPRAAGTKSTTIRPTTDHAINAPIGGRSARFAMVERVDARAPTGGDAGNGAMSMDDSVVADGMILKRRGLMG